MNAKEGKPYMADMKDVEDMMWKKYKETRAKLSHRGQLHDID